MNISRIYFSPTGTTDKITGQVAEGLGGTIKDYNITLLKDRAKFKGLTFNSTDVVIVGVPVYSGRIPAFLSEFFSTLNGDGTLAIFTVMYGHRNYDDALLELKNIFEARGFKGIAAGAFIGEHSFTEKVATGRPDADDLSMALKFGKDCSVALEKLASNGKYELNVKGKFPYKERSQSQPMAPQTNDRCNNCGICAENCPVEAIDFKDFRKVDAEKCIRCCSCIKKCPENAKAFNNDAFAKSVQWLMTNCTSVRKEPELFMLSSH
ncbi:MAG TPA: EFR1 family ferrodoxin [Tenuifilaceae bacterium]|nr:EFR1 family ferrodoxin [Tenuifilaceae bacterium]